jgi:hypothetical protein
MSMAGTSAPVMVVVLPRRAALWNEEIGRGSRVLRLTTLQDSKKSCLP